MANRAVRDYLTSVSQNTLLKQQDSVDLRDLRRELLTSALDYYKEFVRQRGGDPQLRRELAEAHYRLGEIAGEIGTIAESIAAFEAARPSGGSSRPAPPTTRRSGPTSPNASSPSAHGSSPMAVSRRPGRPSNGPATSCCR